MARRAALQYLPPRRGAYNKSIAFSAKSMYIIVSNHYAIEFVEIYVTWYLCNVYKLKCNYCISRNLTIESGLVELTILQINIISIN